jgi:ubiquinone/menaquinone biosynthesis C-methylase UbiE
MSNDSEFVTADYLRRSAQQVKAVKDASYNHMAIESNVTVLDVGCGPGVDAAALAHRVGPQGCVIGLDSDPKMLSEAQLFAEKEGVSERIQLRFGSATALPLGNGVVAASRAERLIQVLPPAEATQVFAELGRVTRAGGRVVVVDTDWATASMDLDDNALERRLMNFFAQCMRPNGFAGRQLFRLAMASGLEQVRIEFFPLLQHRLDATPLEWLVDTALKECVIDEEEQQRVTAELRQKETRGRLYFFTTMVIVSGAVPQG